MKTLLAIGTVVFLLVIGPLLASLLFISPENGYYYLNHCLCGYDEVLFMKDGKVLDAFPRHNEYSEIFDATKADDDYSITDFAGKVFRVKFQRTKAIITDKDGEKVEIPRILNLWRIWYAQFYADEKYRYRSIEKLKFLYQKKKMREEADKKEPKREQPEGSGGELTQ